MESYIKNWGVTHPSKSDYVKNKMKQTNIQNWGVEYAMSNDIIKEKVKIKRIENYKKSYTGKQLIERINLKQSCPKCKKIFEIKIYFVRFLYNKT